MIRSKFKTIQKKVRLTKWAILYGILAIWSIIQFIISLKILHNIK
jgi:hypothetical protein